MTLILKTEKRTKIGNTDSLRKEGFIPAVYYGKKEISTPIQIKKTDFLKIWREAGESTVVALKTADGDKEALIHEICHNPVTGEVEHADFYIFEKGHKVLVSVPLEFIGISKAIKDLGGSLVKALHEIKVEAEPSKLPHEIRVDISSLEDFSSQILASSVEMPKDVTLAENPDEVVASVSAPKEEKEEPVEAPDLSQIEVEKKGKKEEDAEGESV